MISYIPYFVIIIIFVSFISGFFLYKPVAIMSNSMYPLIQRGDVVIVEKMDQKDVKLLKLNDIIEYKIGGSSIIHRVVAIDIESDGNFVFTTKGDNNEFVDSEMVTEEQIIGVVKIKVPKIGYPSVWMNDFFKKNKVPDVETGI